MPAREGDHGDDEAMVAGLTVLTLQAIPTVPPKWCFFEAGGLAG